jgi:hypothetical protein
LSGTGDLAQNPQKFFTAQSRQEHVQENEVRLVVHELAQRFLAVLSQRDIKSGISKNAFSSQS